MSQEIPEALDPTQVHTLETIADRIFPPGSEADPNEPGGAWIGAATYIQKSLAGPYSHHLGRYQRGLTLLDQYCQTHFGQPFTALQPNEQDSVLAALEADQASGGQEFFTLVRQHILEGVFADPKYGGNHDRTGWRLIGYPGAQLAHDPAELECEPPPRQAGQQLERGGRSS